MIAYGVHPILHALGWTLIHFCWQGLAVALLLWCALGLAGRTSSRMRYALACLALTLMFLLPLCTFARLVIRDYRLAGAERATVQATDLVVQASAGAVPEPWMQRLPATLDVCLPWLLAAWIAGVVLLLLRLGAGLWRVRAMRREATDVPRDVAAAFERMRRSLGIQRTIQLLCSVRVEAPSVVGWLRPMVLLPTSCLIGLEPGQVEALLRHELAHIRRHDYLVSILQSVIETLLFYHPAVWWVSCQIRHERECCCDELAVNGGGDVLAYARALSWLEEQRASAPHLALAANGGVLKMRIQRLLGRPQGSTASQFASIAVLTILMLAGVGVAGHIAYAEARSAESATAASMQEPIKLAAPAAEPVTPQVSIAPAFVKRTAPDSTDTASPTAKDKTATNVAQSADSDAQARESADAIARAAASYSSLLRDMSIRGALSGEDRERLADAQRKLNQSIKEWQQAKLKGWQADHKAMFDNNLAHLQDQMQSAKAAITELNTPEKRQQLKDAMEQMTRVDREKLREQAHAARDKVRERNSEQRPIDAAKTDLARINSPEFQKHLNDSVKLQLNLPQIHQQLALMKKSAYVDVDAMHKTMQQELANSKLYIGGAQPPATGGLIAGPKSSTMPRVSSGEMQGLILNQAQPIYPEAAKAARIQGVVVLHARISKEGKVETLGIVSGPPILATSAMDAVKQWTYRPYVLAGNPVGVDTTINVNYSFGDSSRPQERADLMEPLPATDKSGATVYRIGGGVIAPQLTHQAAPEFTEEARKQKFSGVVLVGCVVNEKGIPEDVHIVRGVGFGLNDKAVTAVKKYKFKPATKDGAPVPVALNIEVNFQIF